MLTVVSNVLLTFKRFLSQYAVVPVHIHLAATLVSFGKKIADENTRVPLRGYISSKESLENTYLFSSLLLSKFVKSKEQTNCVNVFLLIYR